MSPTADSPAEAMADAAAALPDPNAEQASGQDDSNVGAGTQNTDITDGSGAQTSDAPPEKTQAELNAEHAAAIQKKLDEQAGTAAGVGGEAGTAVQPVSDGAVGSGSAGSSTTGTLAEGAAAEQEQGDQGDDRERAVTSEDLPEHLQGSPIGEEIMQRLRYFENLVEHLFRHVDTLGGALARTGTAVPSLPHFPSLRNRLGNYDPHAS